jgi:hypothetical protein
MYSDQLRGHLPGPMVERLQVHPAMATTSVSGATSTSLI